ncbi:hypothetical protein QCA50_013566 [Cerrena zonata]|uniref:Uncharacterized protein n=1 Tax=Cerrena zonata TaxID=2478898 RepID=A0AAW0FYN3_9APHY
MAAYHTDFDEVRAAVNQLSTDLYAMQVHAQQAGNPYAPTFAHCSSELGAIVTELRTFLARSAITTANFVYGNILSRALDASLDQGEKLDTLQRFFQTGAIEIRNRSQANATRFWQRTNTLQNLVRNHHEVITQLGSNPTAILNRFQTMQNGIGYLSGGYFQRVNPFRLVLITAIKSEFQIEALVRRVIQRVTDNTLVAADIQDEVTWLLQFKAQMERF